MIRYYVVTCSSCALCMLLCLMDPKVLSKITNETMTWLICNLVSVERLLSTLQPWLFYCIDPRVRNDSEASSFPAKSFPELCAFQRDHVS